MRSDPRKLVLLLLLAFQLVVGLPLQTAQAGMADTHRAGGTVSASMQMTGEGASGGDCPMHGSHAVDGVTAGGERTAASGTRSAGHLVVAGDNGAGDDATVGARTGGTDAGAYAGGTRPAGDGVAAGGAASHASGTHSGGTHPGSHDCCHASACQCHCVYTPAAIHLPGLANATPSVVVPTPADTQFVPSPIDEFLRPPIA